MLGEIHRTHDALRCVVEGARWLGEPSDALLPTKSAISQARIRLGAAPLEALYRAVVAPVATAGTPGAWYRGWRVMRLEGTTLDVGDTAVNAAAFGRQASARGVNTTGAFPQLRLVGLLENGTHAITAAQLGAYGTPECVLAVDVLAGLTGEMLCLADRGFLSFDLWRTAAATGAALVWRAPATVTLPVLERYADGSYRSALRWNPKCTSRDRRPQAVRVIEYTMAGAPSPTTRYRLVTAIDGVKLPSNASKHRSGTRAEFTQRAEKLEKAAQAMLERHRATDALELEPDVAAKTTARIARLTRNAQDLREWLATHPTDRHGPTGGLRKSNRTDNESAKMSTEKGVIQGYTGVATVDAKHQIIVDAQAHGTGSEQELLLPVVTELAVLRTSETVLTADAGYHSEANLATLAALEVTALIADPDMRQRDERFAARDHHTSAPDPLHDKTGATKKSLPVFTPSDFTYDADARTCMCPAGKSLYRKGASNVTNGHLGEHFRGAKRDCAPCVLRAQCLRTPETTVVRNVAFSRGRDATEAETHTMRMQQRLDAPEGREQYGRRFATVEPVFANVRYNKRLDRFTLRGRTKVNGQWLLFCLAHNIEKLTHAGYAA